MIRKLLLFFLNKNYMLYLYNFKKNNNNNIIKGEINLEYYVNTSQT